MATPNEPVKAAEEPKPEPKKAEAPKPAATSSASETNRPRQSYSQRPEVNDSVKVGQGRMKTTVDDVPREAGPKHTSGFLGCGSVLALMALGTVVAAFLAL